MSFSRSILDAIGNTSLVRLRRVVPAGCARILVKVEAENPTGSMKDRIAAAVIAAAERRGQLAPGGTVVEYTGGSTGASLALVCAVKGYRLRLVTSDAFSQDKLTQMAAYGAELTVLPSENGRITRELITAMIARAREITAETGGYWTDQLNNRDSVEGYLPMGDEIWSQSSGTVDAFVHSVGASHSLRGVVTALRRHNPNLRVAAVEPAESPALSQGKAGAHRIEGIGIGYAPPLWDPALVDEIIPIPSADGEEMARRLAREEALFAGTSSGANVLAAIDLGLRLGPEATVATLLVDSGLKYLSTAVYRPTTTTATDAAT